MNSNAQVWQGTGDRILGVIAFLAGLLIAAPFVLLLAAPFMTGL